MNQIPLNALPQDDPMPLISDNQAQQPQTDNLLDLDQIFDDSQDDSQTGDESADDTTDAGQVDQTSMDSGSADDSKEVDILPINNIPDNQVTNVGMGVALNQGESNISINYGNQGKTN